jgi:E3 ubiquitin-protein ligase DOA10
VIAVVVVIAFSNFIRDFTWSVLHFTMNWILINTGIYRIWLTMADKLNEDSLVGWVEKEVDKMKEKVRKERRRHMAMQYEIEKKRRQEQNTTEPLQHDHHDTQNGKTPAGHANNTTAPHATASGTSNSTGDIEMDARTRSRQSPQS